MVTDNYTSITNLYEPSKPLACITLGSVTKLLPTNYLNWQLQVEAFLDGYNLLKYSDGSLPASSKTITTTAETPMTTENPAYQTWRQQDRLIYGALLTTLLNEVAPWFFKQRPHTVFGPSSRTQQPVYQRQWDHHPFSKQHC